MKKTYINPTCKVRAMKTEAIMANTVIGDDGNGDGAGFGGPDGDGGAGADVNRKSLWDEE
jgi:hypothetical protein